MANIYAWFETREARRNFVLELLELDPIIVPRNNSKKALREAEQEQRELDLYLAMLDASKTSSPYYNLHEVFYDGRLPDVDMTKIKPWTELAVFQKGFRQLYTQKSYRERPGHWLVMQFRQSSAGRDRRWWVENQVPEARRGTNVPLPRIALSRRKLKRVRSILNWPQPRLESLHRSLELLLSVKQEHPELFCGKAIYLFEELAYAYRGYHNLQKAEFCLRQQAALQPGVTDAYLNLGAFLMDEGLSRAAIAVYKEGLAIDPTNEYLSFNLASVYHAQGNKSAAHHALNTALVKNPNRGLNHKLKGDFHLENGDLQAALTSYKQAATLLTEEGWEAVRVECYQSLSFVCGQLGQKENARSTLEEALLCDPKNTEILVSLARIYGRDLEDWLAALPLLQRAIESDPESTQSWLLLADCYDEIGERDRSHWCRRKAAALD